MLPGASSPLTTPLCFTRCGSFFFPPFDFWALEKRCIKLAGLSRSAYTAVASSALKDADQVEPFEVLLITPVRFLPPPKSNGQAKNAMPKMDKRSLI